MTRARNNGHLKTEEQMSPLDIIPKVGESGPPERLNKVGKDKPKGWQEDSPRKRAWLLELKSNNPAEFNRIREAEFVKELERRIDSGEKVIKSRFRGSAAYMFGISTQTYERWIEKYCSDVAPFEVTTDGDIKRRW